MSRNEIYAPKSRQRNLSELQANILGQNCISANVISRVATTTVTTTTIPTKKKKNEEKTYLCILLKL